MKFSHSTLSIAIKITLISLAIGTASADDDTNEPITHLGTLAVSFENINRYAPVSSTGSAGLTLTNRETPQMISTVNQARMKDQNLQTMQQVMENTAGMNVTAIDGGRTSFSSRGFDITQFSVDGADIDFNQQMSVGEYHLGTSIYDKIEVTHGATGLVSGSGEPSARINLVRKKADSRHKKTSLSLNANKFESYGLSFDHNQALNKSGTLRGRVVGAYQDGKTFIDREKKGQQQIYATIQADIGDKTIVDIGANYRKNKQRSVMWGSLPSYHSDGTFADWKIGKNGGVDWAKWDYETKEYFTNLEHNFTDRLKLNIKANHNQTTGSPKLFYHGYTDVDKTTGLNHATLTSPWYYSRYRADNSNKQTHIQADLTAGFDWFGRPQQAMIGVHHNKHNLTAYTYNALDNPIPTNFNTWNGSYPEPTWSARGDTPAAKVDTTEKSVYGAIQLKPLDNLSVVAGYRLSDYDKEGVQWGTTVSAKADKVGTPYAGIIWDFDKTSSLYASYTSIFKPQTVRMENGDYLDSEDGNTIEFGIKGSTTDGKLQSQFTVFHTKKDNYAQVTDKIVQGTESTTREKAYIGVDGTVSKGVEIEVNGKLSPHWQMTAGFTQFDIKDKDGKTIATTSSKRMAKLFTIYDMSRHVNGLAIGGGLNWYDKRYTTLTNPATGASERYGQDPMMLINLMGRYSANPNLDFQLNITNVFNKKYKLGIGNNFGQYSYGEPLNVAGSVTYRF